MSIYNDIFNTLLVNRKSLVSSAVHSLYTNDEIKHRTEENYFTELCNPIRTLDSRNMNRLKHDIVFRLLFLNGAVRFQGTQGIVFIPRDTDYKLIEDVVEESIVYAKQVLNPFTFLFNIQVVAKIVMLRSCFCDYCKVEDLTNGEFNIPTNNPLFAAALNIKSSLRQFTLGKFKDMSFRDMQTFMFNYNSVQDEIFDSALDNDKFLLFWYNLNLFVRTGLIFHWIILVRNYYRNRKTIRRQINVIKIDLKEE